MKFSLSQYKKLCEACNDILLESKDNLTRQSIPWLHVLNEHPTTLKKYNQLWLKENYFKDILKFFIFFLLSLLKKGQNKEKDFLKKPGLNVDVLIISHLFHKSQLKEVEDFYFGDLTRKLEEQNLNSIRFMLNHTSTSSEDLIKSETTSKFNPSTYFFLDSLNKKTMIKIFKDLFLESIKLRKDSIEETDIFKKKVLRHASYQALSISSFKSCIYFFELYEILEKLKPSFVLITLEGHAREKLTFFCSKLFSKKIISIGYQHTILFPNQNAIKNYVSKKFIPNMIFTSGEINKKILKKKLSDVYDIKIENVGTFRSKQKKIKNSKTVTKKYCLILPDGNIEDIKNFSHLVEKINIPEKDFLVRLHPSYSLDVLQNKYKLFLRYPKNVEFSKEKDLILDLEKSTYAIYRGSGAIIYALQNGLEPIYFEVNKELPLDPLIDFRENITKVSNVDQLRKALNNFEEINPNIADKNSNKLKELGSKYFEPYNYSKIINFLKSNL